LTLVNADDWLPTAATDGRNFYYNSRFVNMLDPEEVDFLVGHEVLHVVYDHIGRREDRDPQLWNIADDYCVNADLKKYKVGRMITTVPCLYDPKYTGWTAEQVYEDLYKNADKIDLESLIDQLLDDHMDGEEGDDDGKRPGRMTKAEQDALREDIKDAIINAARSAKEAGHGVPDSVARMIKEITEPQMPWRELIQTVLTSAIKTDYTFMRPSRRGYHLDAILPSQNPGEEIDITEAIDTFSDRADVVFASHHWPTWGRERIVEYLSLQRDLYAYLHDQTLRRLNQGHTGIEIAESFTMPPALEQAWHTRGYYGSVNHNVKAVYQRYMGWFDGNPGRLWPHPPEQAGPRYVAAMGGIDRVVELAREAFDAGDFRWAATLLDHAVFTDEEHAGARSLYADTLEQLGYGAECATWRNFFLSGATELRTGNFGTPVSTQAPTMLSQLTPEQMFDVLAISVNGPRAWDLDLALDVTFADLGANYRLTLRNGVLVYRKRPAEAATATATVTLAAKMRLMAAALGDFSSPGLEVSGDAGALQALLGVLDRPDPEFNIVTP
jgi:hypothetical protein